MKGDIIMGFFSTVGSVLKGVSDVLSIFGGEHVGSSSGTYRNSKGETGTFTSDTYDYGNGYQKKYTTFTDSNGNTSSFTEDINLF